MKNEKGITLIALVITVIVMLILAGVAISALTGDGGLFDKTLKSAEAYENAAQKEAKQLDILMNEIDGYIGDLTADKKAPSVAILEVSNITDTGFTLTATGKDNVGISKYEFYIKNEDGSFTLEKTVESEDTTVIYDVTGKNANLNSYIYKLKVYDKSGNSKESSAIVVESIDTTAPSVAKLEVSNITDTGFTLTAIGEDERGIVKYEIYIKNDEGTFVLEKMIDSKDTTVIYDVTGKSPKSSSYEYKLVVYDAAGNSKESDVVVAGGKKASELVSVGDYINYDAGVWTNADVQKISVDTTVSDNVTGNKQLPVTTKTFGGFEIGDSRNENSIGYTKNGYEYTPKTSGWRVWNVDSSTGVVTLISAGHPETYKHASNTNAADSINIIKNRNCEMYVNKYATSARMVMRDDVISWYNATFGTNYTLLEGDPYTSTFFNKTFTTEEPISVLANGGLWWCPGKTSQYYMYYTSRDQFAAGSGTAMGVRVLISLNPEVLLQLGTECGTVDNPWKIAGM